ncbi:Xaa-Pro peptidase family protein [Inediibacterium massiliense]|uniref:M24 family metallopeptidase n=1 Tax=Inediibacterium massiliense TaxID=1658111 RepID=UPI000B1D715E|nr:Xaa-Pro peptidase family protein [Inediibacterium massiliense]
MLHRISKLRSVLQERDLEGILIFKPENRRYISGFTGTHGYVLITMDQAIFITDSRYIQQASKQCIDYDILEHNYQHNIYSIIQKLNLKNIGFEDDFITYDQYLEFKKNLNGINLVPIQGIINDLRIIKDEKEIQSIRKAASIADEAFKHVCSYIKSGMTENEVALELEFFMKKKGASSLSFDTIVASGIRSSLPHGVASSKKIEEGDFITMDFGCIYDGYCSDMTRTIVLGKANVKQKEIYNIVLEAQENALAAIKPGMKGLDIDQIAREIISSRGYGENFGHGLGHGVGLEIHEEPTLSPKGNIILQPGMVVTDEPGIYIPKFGGVRIEDLILVTEAGCEILSKSSKKLIEL